MNKEKNIKSIEDTYHEAMQSYSTNDYQSAYTKMRKVFLHCIKYSNNDYLHLSAMTFKDICYTLSSNHITTAEELIKNKKYHEALKTLQRAYVIALEGNDVEQFYHETRNKQNVNKAYTLIDNINTILCKKGMENLDNVIENTQNLISKCTSILKTTAKITGKVTKATAVTAGKILVTTGKATMTFLENICENSTDETTSNEKQDEDLTPEELAIKYYDAGINEESCFPTTEDHLAAIEYYKKSYKISKEAGLDKLKLKAEYAVSDSYEKLGDKSFDEGESHYDYHSYSHAIDCMNNAVEYYNLAEHWATTWTKGDDIRQKIKKANSYIFYAHNGGGTPD